MRNSVKTRSFSNRAVTLLSTALLLMSPAAVFASGKACNCTKKCMSECQHGKGKKCKCKACECKHEQKCGEGEASCHMESTAPTPAAATEEKK